MLSDSWTSSLRNFGETFTVAFDISKDLHKIGQKASVSKLPSFIFFLSPCGLISNFLINNSIAAVVDDHRSFPKPRNSVPLDSVLSLILFLLVNDFSFTSSPIHYYVEDSTLLYSTRFDRCLSQQILGGSSNDVVARLSSDPSLICERGRGIL